MMIEELIAAEQRARAERDAAQERLDIAEQAVLEERFRDVERYHRGDIILVPRQLFGKRKWWPAQVVRVDLYYSEGTDAKGQPWVTKFVSYSVFLQQKDGTFGGSSASFYHSEVRPERDAYR